MTFSVISEVSGIIKLIIVIANTFIAECSQRLQHTAHMLSWREHSKFKYQASSII